MRGISRVLQLYNFNSNSVFRSSILNSRNSIILFKTFYTASSTKTTCPHHQFGTSLKIPSYYNNHNSSSEPEDKCRRISAILSTTAGTITKQYEMKLLQNLKFNVLFNF